MHVSHLSLHDFRSYSEAEVALAPGVTAFVGRNGQGKTNLVEAVDYIARLASHRVAGDGPLVRLGADHAVVRAAVVRDGREAVLEVQINPGRSNRARVNRSPLPRARELLGLVRTVLFSPEDLALVKGDPSERRRFLDDLLVQRAPRFAGVRADHDRVLKQRNSLLKTALQASRAPGGRTSSRTESTMASLDVWDVHLAHTAAELLQARLALVDELAPYVARAYQAVAQGAPRTDATMTYRSSFELPEAPWDRQVLEAALLAELGRRRKDEVERGISLVGPHRDDLLLMVGPLPIKGYASHGESWSAALALRLASYDLLRASGDDPILILDDVFAELDTERRERLAELVAGAEQVLVTAAVADDIPAALAGARIDVVDGKVLPVSRETGGDDGPGPGPGEAAPEGAGPEQEEQRPHDETGLDLARSIARSLAGPGARRRMPPGRRSPRRVDPQASGAHPDERDPQLLDSTIGRLIAEQGWGTDVRVHGVFSRWDTIVGREVSQHCTPEAFTESKLTVRTDSTAWATQMKLLAPTVVRRLNQELGDGTVSVIEVLGPHGPTWKRGLRSVRDGRGPRDTYG